jgi:hypothetical protein
MSKYNNEFLTKTMSFSITHTKHMSLAGPTDANGLHLKSIQKSAAYMHCFNPMTHQE